jgi:hypothetical protein
VLTVNTHLIEKEKEIFTMTRMGKVLLVAMVLLLTCSPAIAANTTNIKGKDIKKIKVYVHKETGQIVGVKLKKDDGTEEDATMVSPTTPGTLIGTILFHKSSPGCYVVVSGGQAWQICW